MRLTKIRNWFQIRPGGPDPASPACYHSSLLTRCDVRRLRRFLLAGLGLAIAGACSTPEFDFVPDPTVEHCANEIQDVDLGETDTDCGGADCRQCDLGQGCLETADCIAGQCVEGFCQAEGCDNGAQDEGETDVDCGGSCKPCDPGQVCEVPADCASKVCPDGTCSEPTCDDGVINGTETGRDCGGGLCDGCGTGSPCNSATDCRSGVCAGEQGTKKCEVSCVEGTAECDGETDVECETNVLTDPLRCGDCETVCELAHAEQSCVSGACQIGACVAPYDNCNNEVEDGCETNLTTSETDCGACGSECSDDNGVPSCVASECQIECNEGFRDCDGTRVNGCETSVGTDVEACGTCTTVCPIVPGETPWCRNGVCGGTPCEDGLGNCDGLGETCERDLTADIENCGRCGGVCTVRNGTPECDAGNCAVLSCESGFDNCNVDDPDGGYADGCETNTNDDPMNCGVCGQVCSAVNGTAACVNGQCRVMTCSAGYQNCNSGSADGGYADGCETNTNTSKANCGACGTNCDTVLAPSNATGRCMAGLCQRDMCLSNFGDCDTNAMICESDFRTDETDCGDCNTSCSTAGTTPPSAGVPGNQCLAGDCNPNCDANHEDCDGQGPNGCEIDVRTNNMHCGGCNAPCNATGRTCMNRMCVCTGGLTLCGGNCVNTQTDNSFCGSCTNACTGGRTCVSGVCQCPSGQTFCGSTCVNLQTDESHCGACSQDCEFGASAHVDPPTQAGNQCASGVCDPNCATGFDDCDTDEWNGCEASLTSSSHCGVCNRACETAASAHVTANTCSSGGACQPSCATGWGDCDGQPWDGCEADITSPATCGTSCTACASATSACVLSGSTRSCQATIAMPANGSVGDGVVGPTLTLMHNLTVASGQNRVVVVGVVTRAAPPSGGITAAAPNTVTYGGTAMNPGPTFDGGQPVPSTDGQGHVYFYWLNNAGLPTSTGTRAVVIDGSPGTLDPTVVTGMAVTLTGVNQTNPLTAGPGGTFGACSNSAPVVQPSNAVTLATTGSVILSMSGAQYPGAASPTGSLTMLMDNEPGESGTMKAVGGIRGHTSQLASPGPHTVGWNYAWCNNSVHFTVVVNPAQQ